MHLNKIFLTLLAFSSAYIFSGNDKLQIARKHSTFLINDGNETIAIKREFTDPLLSKMNNAQLEQFLKVGYIKAIKMSDNNYKLVAKTRGLGGGPISGWIAYWAVKSLCYGTAVAGAGTLIVTTGGAAGAATGGIIAAATAGVSTGATVVAGTIAGAGLASEAALATGALVAGAGSITGAVAAVETASVVAGGFFAAIPFLP